MAKKQQSKIIEDSSIKIWESNTLAIAPMNEILHPNSLKLFLYSIYHAVDQKQYDKDGKLYGEFSISEFAKFFDIDARNTYQFAQKWSEKISNYQYYFKRDDNEEEFHKVVAIPEVKYKKGMMTTYFSKPLVKHLLELSDSKIFIDLKILKKFKNPRFIKLYEYFKAKVYLGQKRIVNISINNLYRLLVIKEGTYNSFGDFNRWILKPILRNFADYKGMDVKVRYVKKNKKINSLQFLVANNEGLDNNFNNTVNKICPKCGGNLKIAKSEFGEFYGCSNYPQCDFKASIKVQSQKSNHNNGGDGDFCNINDDGWWESS